MKMLLLSFWQCGARDGSGPGPSPPVRRLESYFGLARTPSSPQEEQLVDKSLFKFVRRCCDRANHTSDTQKEIQSTPLNMATSDCLKVGTITGGYIKRGPLYNV